MKMIFLYFNIEISRFTKNENPFRITNIPRVILKQLCEGVVGLGFCMYFLWSLTEINEKLVFWVLRNCLAYRVTYRADKRLKSR